MSKAPKYQQQTSNLTLLAAGVLKHYGSAGTLAFGNTTYKVDDLHAQLQKHTELIAAVVAASAARTIALNNLREQAPPLRKVESALVRYVRAQFGNAPDALGDFGLAPYKAPATKTVETKTAAVQKNLATREARHTVGPKARKAIKGTAPSTAGAAGPAAGGTGGKALATIAAPAAPAASAHAADVASPLVSGTSAAVSATPKA
jgi:hypothetical protein